MDLSQSDWEYVDKRAGAFVGREWVFAQVRGFLSGPPGTFLLRGDPGTGKTAVAGRLVQASCGRLDMGDSVPPVGEGVISAGAFCRAGKATVAELAQRLSDQLAASVDGFADALRATAEAEHGITVSDVHVDVHGDVHAGGTVAGVMLPQQDGKQAFRTGVAVPLRHLREQGSAQPIVLLVDAVDEAADVGEVNTFSRLLGNLDGVHLIVTCRADPSVLSNFRAAAHKLDLITDAPAGDDDVRRYIRDCLTGQGPEEAVDVLTDRVSGEADGNFLYAFYVTGTLIGSGLLAGMDAKTARGLPLPTGGLAGVYEDFLDRQVADGGTRWTRELRPVLAPLCVALGNGFTTAQLAAVASRLTDQDFSLTKAGDVTRAAGQFLDGPRPNGPFRVYHQSFSRFLTDPGQNPDWHIDITEANNAVVRALMPEGQPGARDWTAASPYVRRHLAGHAAAAGILDDLLIDPGYLVAAHPVGLLPALTAATSSRARQIARIYRTAADGIRTEDLAERAMQLQLAAGKAGEWRMAAALGDVAGSSSWRTRVLSWARPGRFIALGSTGSSIPSAITVTASGDVVVFAQAWLWRLDKEQLVPVEPMPDDPEEPMQDGEPRAAIGQLGGALVVVTGEENGAVRLYREDDDQGFMGVDYKRGHRNRGPAKPRKWTLARDIRYFNLGLVRAVAVGRLDDRLVAVTGGADGLVRLWRVEAGELMPVWSAHHCRGDRHAWVTSVAAVAAGQFGDRRVAVSCDEHTIRLWRIDDEGLVPVGKPSSSYRSEALALALVGGRLMAVTGDRNGDVTLWRVGSKKLVEVDSKPGHDDCWVTAVALGQLGDVAVAVTGGEDGTVRLWRVDHEGLIPTGDLGSGHHDELVSAAAVGLRAGQPVAVTAGVDGTVRLWPIDDQELAPPSDRQTDYEKVGKVAVGQVGGRWMAVTNGPDGIGRVWRIDSDELVSVGGAQLGYGNLGAVAIGQVRDQVVVITGDGGFGVVGLWRLDEESLVPVGEPQYDNNSKGVSSVAIAQLGNRAFAVAFFADGAVRLWRVRDGGLVPVGDRQAGHDGMVWGVALAQLGGRLVAVSTGNDGAVRLWRVDKEQLVPDGSPDIAHFGGGGWRGSKIGLGQFGSGLAAVTSGSDGSIRLWRINEDGLMRIGERQEGHGHPVSAVAVGQLGNRPIAVTGGYDLTIRLWQLRADGLTSIPGGRIQVGSVPLCVAVLPTRVFAWCRDGVLTIKPPALERLDGF